MDDGFGVFQPLPEGAKMSKSQNQEGSSLLWDCFTNWSLTLEKTAELKDPPKKEPNENSKAET
jgi:hypothetical protein